MTGKNDRLRLALLFLSVTGLQLALAQKRAAGPPVPGGYTLLASIHLDERKYSREVIASFNVEKASHVNLYILVREIDTPYFDLVLSSQQDDTIPLLHGEGFSASLNIAQPELDLSPDPYELVLSSSPSPGSVDIYLSTE